MPAPAPTTTARPDPAGLRAAMGQVEALDDVPAGPALAAALATLDLDRVPGLGLTYVMAARNRQANHERGELLVTIGHVLRHGRPAAAALLPEPGKFAANEIRAALRLTRSAAQRLSHLAWDLHRRLPAVLTAMRQGRLDQPRAQVFSTWTDGLSREHTHAILLELLPAAPELTTGELIEAIARLAIALDPEWIRRRYERALRGRRVIGTRNPDGTATLTGHDLPVDEVAAACARLDALAHAAKSAGHPDRLDHLRVELFLGMLTGRYTHQSDQDILTTLHATAHTRPDTTHSADHESGDSDPDGSNSDPDDSDDDDGDDDDGDDDDGDDDDADPDDGCISDPNGDASPDPDQDGDRDPDRNGGGNAGGHGGCPDGEGPDDNDPNEDGLDGEGSDDDDPDDGGPDDDGPQDKGSDNEGHDDNGHDDNGPDDEGPNDDSPDDDATDGDTPPDDSPDGDGPGGEGLNDAGPPGSGGSPGAGSCGGVVGRRGGLRLWAGLATVMGADQRPAELLGWGPVHAELAGDLARSLRSWWCVIAGADGAPQAIVPVRRRPTATTATAVGVPRAAEVRRAGEVWLQIDPAGLRLLTAAARAGLVEPGWAAILAEITTRLQSTPTGPPNTDPAARLPGAALRRWIHIRDRRCVFPGCRAPAHRADTDHSIEFARGGATTDAGLAPACRHDHMLRHEGGWTVAHTAPGQLTWTSPLGRRYRRRPPPGLLDLPEPRPGAIDERDPEPGPEHPLPGSDPISCLQPQPTPPPRPPPAPPSAPRRARNPDWILGRPGSPDDEPPPF